MSRSETLTEGTLSEGALDALVPVLERLHRESRATSMHLVDRRGGPVFEVWRDAGGGLEASAPPAAVRLGETASLARLFDGDEFSLLSRGEDRDSVYLARFEQGLVLALYFGGDVAPGLVRLRVRQASREIREIMHRASIRQFLSARWGTDDLTAQDIDDFFTF